MRRTALVLSIFALSLAARPATAAIPNSCVFTISMISGTDLNNLDFVVNYTQTGGDIYGSSTHPDCANALNGQAFAGFHDDEAGHLSVSSIRLHYFSAPVELAGCRILYDSNEPIPADFTVQVSNAGRDGEDGNVDPLPTVAVTKVECPGELPMPTTTTTTMEPTTTTTLVGGERCGFPLSDGTKPVASDALYTLKTAVGVGQCAACVCDINSSGGVTASDALGVLRAAVGISTTLDCPAC